jgi:predicted ATPase
LGLLGPASSQETMVGLSPGLSVTPSTIGLPAFTSQRKLSAAPARLHLTLPASTSRSMPLATTAPDSCANSDGVDEPPQPEASKKVTATVMSKRKARPMRTTPNLSLVQGECGMIVEEADIPGRDGSPWRGWPFDLPCVRQILEEPLRFEEPITMLVGENGSGKSTLVEALAEAYGMDVRGGHGGRSYASDQPKSPLGAAMRLTLSPASERVGVRKRGGFFLRSETAFGVFRFMSDKQVSGYGERHLDLMSHGEGYLQVLEGRFGEPGLLLLDEPEAPLSFQACLALVDVVHQAVRKGSQVICATHSPLLAAAPGAQILEIGEHGIRSTTWEELDMVDHWRRYLDDPSRYLRHLLAE